jgi:hypothetical protein
MYPRSHSAHRWNSPWQHRHRRCRIDRRCSLQSAGVGSVRSGGLPWLHDGLDGASALRQPAFALAPADVWGPRVGKTRAPAFFSIPGNLRPTAVADSPPLFSLLVGSSYGLGRPPARPRHRPVHLSPRSRLGRRFLRYGLRPRLHQAIFVSQFPATPLAASTKLPLYPTRRHPGSPIPTPFRHGCLSFFANLGTFFPLLSTLAASRPSFCSGNPVPSTASFKQEIAIAFQHHEVDNPTSSYLGAAATDMWESCRLCDGRSVRDFATPTPAHLTAPE